MKCALILLLLGLSFPPPSALAAGGPAYLTASCTPPLSLTITCSLTGHNFRPRDAIAVTYILGLLGERAPSGGPKQSMYWRSGTADAQGTFVRPPLRFKVRPFHGSFRMSIWAVDRAGDGAHVDVFGTS